MTRVSRITGYAIEGLGVSTSKTGGLVLHATDHPAPSSTYEWIAGLTDEPSDAGRSLDPLAGELRTGGYTLIVSASERLAGLFGAPQLDTTLRLATTVTSVATSVIITGLTGAGGTVVWIGDEAILLGAGTGPSYTSCTRGFWGTTASAHAAGVKVWSRNPYLRGRLVRRLRYDRTTGAEVVVWRGLITRVTTTDDGAAYRVETVDALQGLREATLNRDAERLDQEAPTVREGPGGVYLVAEAEDPGVRIVRGSPTVWLQLGGEDYVVPAQAAGGRLVVSVGTVGLLGTRLATGDLPRTIEGAWWPLLIVDRLGGVSPLAALDLPYHPLNMMLALLTSTGTGSNGAYDLLAEQWGLGWGADLLDVAAIEAERDATPEAAIDQLVLGWDGKTVSPWRLFAETLLRPFGLYLGQSAGGALTVRRQRLPSLAVLAEAPEVGRYPTGPLALDQRLDRRVSNVVAEVGALPWGGGRRVTVVSDTARRRRLDDERLVLDLSTLRPETLDLGLSVEGLLAAALVHMLVLQLNAAPHLTIDIADPQALGGDPLVLGDQVQLSDLALTHAWFVGQDGARFELAAGEARSCALVVGVREMPSSALRVTLALWGWRMTSPVRERAPSGRSDAYDSGSATHTLDADAFGFPGGDGLSFEVGDELIVCDGRGAPLTSAVRVVTARTADTVEVESHWGVSVPSGSILRLADSTTYANATRYPTTARPYVYLGDTSGEFEDSTGATVSDPWGTTALAGAGEPPASPVFGAIDDAALALSGDAAQPLDAWLEQRLRESGSYNLTTGSALSWQRDVPHAGAPSSYLGMRPHCSFAFSTFLCVPWLMQPDLAELRVALIGRVATESAESSDKLAGAYDVRARLEFDGTQIATLTNGLSNTESDTPEAQPHTLTLSLDAPRRPRRRTLGQLTLWGRGGREASASDQSSGIERLAGDVALATSSATLFAEGATGGGRPNSASIEVCGYLNGARGHDPIAEDTPVGSNPSIAVTPALIRGVNNVSRYRLDYLQLRGVELRETFADSSAPPASAYVAQRDASAELTLAHALRAQGAEARARCIYVGPPGERDAGAPWPTGYGPAWPRTSADDGATILLDAPVWPDQQDGGRLIVLAYVLPTWCMDLPVLQGQEPGEVRESAALCPWTVTATLSQMESGDTPATAAGRGSVSATVTWQHWPTERSGDRPALAQEWYLYDGQWTYREGQLFEADLQWLQPLALSFEMTSLDDAPCWLRLTVEADHGATIYPADLAPSHDPGTPTSADRLRLALVGVSVWEEPR